MLKINYWKLAVSIVICQLAGIIGSFFTSSSVSSWYLQLNKPSFSPPNWIFGPVWITLYTLMGISLFLVWKKGIEKKDVRAAVMIFGLHLFLNALWSFLFFGLQNPFIGLIGILLVLISLLVVIRKFYSISKKSAYILIPYLVWVSFATLLNFSIWILNL